MSHALGFAEAGKGDLSEAVLRLRSESVSGRGFTETAALWGQWGVGRGVTSTTPYSPEAARYHTGGRDGWGQV